MKHILLASLFFATQAFAGLPPTTSRGNGDSSNITTFNFQFPNITVAHTGTTAAFGYSNIAGGGTNNPSLGVTSGGVLYTDGSKVMNVGAGTSGYLLQSNGSSAPTWVAPGSGSAWFIQATQGGDNPDLGVSAVSSYTETVAVSMTLTPGSGSAAVGTMCSGTNAATAPSTSPTTCSAGNESVGINFDITSPGIGAYEVCFYFTHLIAVDFAESVGTVFQIYETPTNAQTLTLAGGTRMESGFSGASSGSSDLDLTDTKSITTCSIFNWGTAGIKGVRLMFVQSVSGSPDASVLLLASSGAKDRIGTWTVHRYGR